MFEWLKDYRDLEERIAYLEHNLDMTKNELKRWENTRDLGRYKLQADSLGANVEEKIEVIEYELAHKMNDLFKVSKLIRSFKGLENQILYYKYVEGETLVGIADRLNKSPNYIYNKHAQIMRMIDYAVNFNVT